MKNKKNLISKLFCTVAILYCASFFAQNTYAEHTLSLSTSGSQVIDVSSVGDRTSISETEVNVSTSCQAGYNLSLSTSVSDNNLYLNGDSNNNATGQFFSPSDGINSLLSSDNTWGYYLPDSVEESPTANSVFSAVPAFGDIAILKTPAQTARLTPIDDTFSIYYGVKVSRELTSGVYTMTKEGSQVAGSLIYYATLPEDCFMYTIDYNPTGTNKGLPVTGIGHIDNQIVTEGITDSITSEVFGNPTIDGVTYYFTGWNTAQDGTGDRYVSGQSISDLSTPGSTIVLYAQWTDCPPGNICYLKNNVDAEGTMGKQPILPTDNSSTLLASNYSYEGHGFAGWSTSYNYEGDYYGPNETISYQEGEYTEGYEGLSLYAIWVEADDYMQDWSGCDNLTTVSYDIKTGQLNADLSSVIALTDMRDNQSYSVARLADGKCWMIENLRLSSEYTTSESSSSLSQGYGLSELYGNFIGLAESENSHFADTSYPNSLYGTNDESVVNINTNDYPNFRLPRYNDTNVANRTIDPNTNNTSIYGYGNYYNWPAAMASTKHYTSGYIEEGDENDKSNQANTSLCPSGWRMPYGSDIRNSNYDGDLAILDVSMGGSGLTNSINNKTNLSMSHYWRKFPNNLVYSGNANGSSIDSRGINGYIWTTTASDYKESYGLSLGTTYMNPGISTYEKHYGFSVRCIYVGNE